MHFKYFLLNVINRNWYSWQIMNYLIENIF